MLALVLVLIAGRLKPGGELDLATEVRDAAIDSVVGDLRAVEADLTALALAHAIRHPFDSTLVAGLAAPLVAMLLKAAKKEKGETENDGG